MPIKVLKKDENKTIPVAHSKYHSDVKTTEKIIKKDREKAKEDFPIFSKVFGAGNPKKDTEKAKRVADTLQTMASKIRTKTEGSFKKGGLSAGQKKIAAKAPPPDKITGADFAVLKKEKAKGRGMGLQDESIKPGKVMKAKTGKQIVKEFSASLKGIDESFKSKVHPMKKQRLLDRSTVMTKAKYGKMMKAKRGKFLGSDPTKPISSVKPLGTLGKGMKVSKAHSMVLGKMSNEKLKEMVKTGINPDLKGDPNIKRGSQKTSMEAKSFLDRRKELASPKNILNAAKATRYGKIALGIAGVALGAKELLKSKMKKEDKKMVGGMAKKYSVGGGADMGAKRDFDKITERTKIYAKAESMKDTDRLTNRDIQESTKALKPYQRKSRRYAATPGNLPKPAIGKMAGGMAKKYSVGGGLDMGGPKGKLMAYAKENLIKDKDKLTLRDKAMIKNVMNMDKSEYPAAERYYKKLTSTKKMGGGMMQRPMGYKSGIMVKARGCKLGRTRPTKMY